MTKYIIRLDDACETMDQNKWNRIENILDSYNIKPIVSVIPHNEDPELMIEGSNRKFWDKVLSWQEKGWNIALHGYNHVYITNQAGLIPMNHRSEFAGVNIGIQKVKIMNGISIMHEKGIKPIMWVAPSHTFDKNTLKVLKENTNIRIISDGISMEPYSEDGFVWIPVQNWKPKKKEEGVWTTCLHPNMLKDEDFCEIKEFIHKNQKDFANNTLTLYQKYLKRKKSIKDILFEKYFFTRRFISSWKNEFLNRIRT